VQPTLSPVATSRTEQISPRIYAPPQPRHWLPKLVVVVEWLVLLVALGYLVGRTLPSAWRPLNTDFPNYYITARLLREGYGTDRIYEWIWFQRQKDHLGIRKADQPIVGFVPDTPFSALVVWPLTFWAPLAAKHIWTLVNLALLAWVAVLLRSLTAMDRRRIALLMVLTYPLHRNLELGQYYVLLLLVVTLALWCYVREKRFLAGALMGIGFGLKIFPVLFVIYFARKRDLRAVLGLITGVIATSATSVWAFGWQLNRLYALQVLPWALRGEVMDPYNLGTNSLSSLLHRLLLFEPALNPLPVVHAPALFAVLHPLLQVAIFAPAVLLAIPGDWHPRRLQLEWSAFLIAVLAISTMPASYHFTLVILPVVVMASELIRERDLRSLVLLALLYLGICFPAWRHDLSDGWWPLLAVPRLYFLILFCLLFYAILSRPTRFGASYTLDRWLWPGALAAALVFGVASTLHHQHGLYENYSSRLGTSSDILMTTNPVAQDGSVLFTALLPDGYRTGIRNCAGTRVSNSTDDRFSQSAAIGRIWTEESRQTSRIVSGEIGERSSRPEVEDAEFPVVSADGEFLAYLRSTKGRSRLWLRPLQNGGSVDAPITPPDLDVREMSFLSDHSLVFSAAANNGAPQLFAVDLAGNVRPLDRGEARYPSVSPDGRWLAYGRQDRGVWNLWLMDLHHDQTRRVTNEECNDIVPTWEADSHTLVFASDCGRALWLTALSRRRVIP
jgi:Glycosyltransferase family 87/WD40-like Beta Propeller Repeat